MAWRGVVEFKGVPINVEMHARAKVTRRPSFKILAHDEKPPVKGLKYDQAGVEIDETFKGVELGKDDFRILSEEALELIDSVQKTVVIKPQQIVPLSSIDISLAIKSYEVVPDENVPGCEKNVDLLWNGLRGNDWAYVTQFAPSEGSMDSVLVIYATETSLRAASLPFANELHAVPTYEFTKNDKAAKMFGQAAKAEYEGLIGEFDHVQYASEFLRKRAEAIEAVLDGKPIVVPETKKQSTAPDLMAMLESAVEETGAEKAKKKAPAKKTTRKKVKA